MKNITLFILILITLVYADDPVTKKMRIQAHRTNEEIKIDAELNEAVWKNTPVVDFLQKEPNEGQKATENTNVWVAYDNDNIYVAVYLYDSMPDSISSHLCRKDQEVEGDFFAVFIDSYNDKRNCFYFLTSPAGSVQDGVFFNDDWNDNTWNGVWDSKSRITNDGWICELKIPFSQLRFNKQDSMTWGINFLRRIFRKNEESYFILVKKAESGFVSHFAELTNLIGIVPEQRIEILPYTVGKAQYLIHDENDPFYKNNQYKLNLGMDLKVGISSNLTLDATINPDFGQVEVDPAVLNLSAFETYYEEKRPFFIEGSSIFDFGRSGANNNWSFNFSMPNLFYSRRIGKQPKGDLTHFDDNNSFVDYPNQTQILTAAKVTGKLENGWSLGFMNALTERTYARVDSAGVKFNDEVEPFTYFGVARVMKEFNDGNQALGFMVTHTNRDLRTDNLREIYSKHSTVAGLDGWLFLDSKKDYVLTYFLASSYIQGTKDFITNLQSSSLRYLQRPDIGYMKIDSNKTSLSGYYSRIVLNKQQGNSYINASFGIISPGYDNTDLGFQGRSNLINSHILLGYRWYEPDDIFRRKQIYVAYHRSYDYDGNKTSDGLFAFINFQFLNYYGFDIQANYAPEYYTHSLFRGGPLGRYPSEIGGNIFGYTDERKSLIFEAGMNYYVSSNKSSYKSFSFEGKWRINSSLNIMLEPEFELNKQNLQWITKVDDPLATKTYNARYILGELDQKTLAMNFRLDWAFTPTMSLQVFAQALISSGNYGNFKELKEPGTLDYKIYGTENSSIKYDNGNDEYIVTPDNTKPNNKFTISNPNFNFKSLRGSFVFRWEYLPGSVLYLVWTRDQMNFKNPGEFSLKRDFNDLLNSQSDNIFLVKLTYWFNFGKFLK